MRFHVKRFIIGIWSTTAVGIILVVLLFREGNESGSSGQPQFPEGHKIPLFKGTQNRNVGNKSISTRGISPLLSKQTPANVLPPTIKDFHPAIHANPHLYPTGKGKQQPKQIVFNVTNDILAKYKYLYDIPPDQLIYNHGDYDPDHLWPTKQETDDRIVAQINHQPKVPGGGARKTLKILVYNGLPSDARAGKSKFVKDKCAVQDCELISDSRDARTADVILFQNSISAPYSGRKTPNQIWVLFFLESAKYTTLLESFKSMVNLTATYRRDSHLVTPYEKFVPFKNVTQLPKVPLKNYAANKVKKVAWFVSNCGTSNGRLNYAKELQKYISVDIYGACGKLHCFRSKAQECFKMLSTDYKFYLAFENSNCKDYITEKLYWNGLYNEVIPVVMGASPEDYASVAPPHSYIHVDDFASPKELAEYLHILDQNDHLYNQYFLWKNTGEFINTYFWCRLCAMSHEALNSPVWVEDVEKWWRNTDTCVSIHGAQKWVSWRGQGGIR